MGRLSATQPTAKPKGNAAAAPRSLGMTQKLQVSEQPSETLR